MNQADMLRGSCLCGGIAITLGTLEPEYDGPVQRELHTDTKPSWLPVR